MKQALIATVGGSAEPVVLSILTHEPAFVCFVCSQGSVDQVAGIKAEVAARREQQGEPLEY